jgi:mono/diheme cytochrome c family protein
MWATRIAAVVCLLVAAAIGVTVFAAWQPAIDPITPPAAAGFDPGLVKRGAELAAIGNCDTCHTARGGRDFAGGVAVPTPFGTIYSTNITPDAETGIGSWSEAAFQRALRKGVRRDGAYLYPAFPYDHLTLVTDDDDKALYAFLMTRAPVHAAAPENKLAFPLNWRPMLFGWNLLFLHTGPYQADGAHDGAWNRGAYLAEGLGHCGACHTPRNALGAEKTGEKFAGGEAEGWTAYALSASSPAPVPWSADALFGYLHRGFDDAHGVAAGPMGEVAVDLRAAPETDVRAIATYVAAQTAVASSGNKPAAAQAQRGAATAAASADSQAGVLRAEAANGDEGALIYAGACAGCHEGPRALPYGGINLALSSAIAGPSATNLANVVLHGLPAAGTAHGPIMPAFGTVLDDTQLATLARYLRAHFTDKGPWNDVEKSVREARSRQWATVVSALPAGQAHQPE